MKIVDHSIADTDRHRPITFGELMYPTGKYPNWFSQPHPFDASLPRRINRAVLVGLFITLFLGIFRPFGLDGLSGGIWMLALGYGMVTFFAMALIDAVMIGAGVDPERWTLGRELLASMANILLIGVLNAVYSFYMGLGDLSLYNVAVFTLYAFLIGIFPVSTMVLINFQRQKVRFALASDAINAEIERPVDPIVAPSAVEEDLPFVLVGENKDERLAIGEKDLLFLKASDNYVEVHHRRKAAVERTLLRGALRMFEEQLAHLPEFMRCHKSYIVNMELVQRVSGNAQGLRLHLKDDGGEVPVSRSLNAEVRRRLAVRPGTPSHSSRMVPDQPGP